MNLVSLLGLAGSFTAAMLFFPQVYQAWKTKRTEELSWGTVGLGLANGIFWTSYGILKADPFIYVTNAILFSALAMLAVLKKRYG